MVEGRTIIRRVAIHPRLEIDDYLGAPSGKDVSPDKFRVLKERFPSFVGKGGYIELKRPIDHPDLKDLLIFCERLDIRPSAHRAEDPQQISISDYVTFPTSEIKAAEFLEISRGAPFIANAEVNTKWGGLQLRVASDQYIKRGRKREFGSFVNLYHLLAVRGEAQRKLERAQLNGLRLVKLETCYPDQQWPEGIEPLSLLWSEYVLPPVDREVFDNGHNVYRPSDPDFVCPNRGCYLLDGHNIAPCLRYRKLDMGEFDIGITRERFGGEWNCYRKIVYSKRAQEVIAELFDELHFQPVELINSQ
jgi:hypothetical protein